MWPFKKRKPTPDAVLLGMEIIDLREEKTPPISEIPILELDGETDVSRVVMSICMVCNNLILTDTNEWGQVEIS